MQRNLLRAYKAHSKLDFSHLFYMDGCILIAHAIATNAVCLSALIDACCIHFGQAVNYDKSDIS